jgi:hypothetical protein
MDVSLAVLADYANISREGKLNVLGIFNTVHIRTFPGGLPQAFLVVRLTADVEEREAEHQVRFRLVDPDGKWLTEMQVEMGAPGEGVPGPPETDLILPAAPLLIFEREGPHEVTVSIDGTERRALRVTAIRVAPPEEDPEAPEG